MFSYLITALWVVGVVVLLVGGTVVLMWKISAIPFTTDVTSVAIAIISAGVISNVSFLLRQMVVESRKS